MGFPLTGLFDLGTKLIDRLIPDKEAQNAAKLKLLELQQQGELAQLQADTDLAKGQVEINKMEAVSPNAFVSGWRPFIGWTCGAIFAANYIGLPLLAWLSPWFSLPPPPRLEIGEILPVLLGMLGLGGMRTTEKLQAMK